MIWNPISPEAARGRMNTGIQPGQYSRGGIWHVVRVMRPSEATWRKACWDAGFRSHTQGPGSSGTTEGQENSILCCLIRFGFLIGEETKQSEAFAISEMLLKFKLG